MKIIDGTANVQIRDDRGHLVRSFPTVGEAEAFLAGYSEATRNAAALIRETAAESVHTLEQR